MSLKRHIIFSEHRLPTYVSPDAQLKYLKPGRYSYDQDLINIAQKYVKEDTNVWDIGANVGVFTFVSSVLASKGSVVCVEADTWLVSLLRKTARLKFYETQDIRVLPVAISDTNGVGSFLIAHYGRASNALKNAGGRSQMGGVRETQWVPTMTLDTLLNHAPHPDFIKIDVEGAELAVIRGAIKVVQLIRPVFYIEVGSDSSEEMLRIFHNEGYISCGSDGSPISDECEMNTFFIPSEKSESIQA